MIGKHVTGSNLEELLELSENTNAKELERQLRGEKPPGKAHCLVMYFNSKDYAELEQALLQHGAVRGPGGRGLQKKEKALIDALRKAAPGLEKVQTAKWKPAHKSPEDPN